MRLKKIRVSNFRSVDDSEEFDADPVTCLVGKNEAGKSAILLALAALQVGLWSCSWTNRGFRFTGERRVTCYVSLTRNWRRRTKSSIRHTRRLWFLRTNLSVYG